MKQRLPNPTARGTWPPQALGQVPVLVLGLEEPQARSLVSQKAATSCLISITRLMQKASFLLYFLFYFKIEM